MRGRIARVLLAVPVIAAVVVSCSEPPQRPPVSDTPSTLPPASGGGTDGGGGDAATTTDSGTDAAEACNSIDLTGNPQIEKEAVAAVSPTETGGSVVDGTYRLTDDKIYTGIRGQSGLTGLTVQSTIVIATGALDTDLKVVGASNPDIRSSGTYTPTASSLAFTPTCPAAQAPKTYSYTASPSSLELLDPTTGELMTFTRM